MAVLSVLSGNKSANLSDQRPVYGSENSNNCQAVAEHTANSDGILPSSRWKEITAIRDHHHRKWHLSGNGKSLAWIWERPQQDWRGSGQRPKGLNQRRAWGSASDIAEGGMSHEFPKNRAGGVASPHINFKEILWPLHCDMRQLAESRWKIKFHQRLLPRQRQNKPPVTPRWRLPGNYAAMRFPT